MTTFNVDALYGMDVFAADSDKIGTIDEVFLDDVTKRPEWAEVKGGLFGKKVALVPLSAAEPMGDGLRLPFDKKTVQGAPRFDHDAGLSIDEERQLFDYYQIPYGGPTATAEGMPGVMAEGRPGATAETGRGGDDAMTRSEEQLQVGTERHESGRVRLHKYVVTENVTQTVPVSHEEVRVEREPITDANRDAALSGPDITEREHEEILHEERPVVSKETVPVERVRLEKDTVGDEEAVSEELRKERIEVEGDSTEGRRRAG